MDKRTKIEIQRKKFSIDEDARLKKLVCIFGPGNWGKISKMMDNRNARQCRDRYNNYLSPHLNLSPYTYEEEIKLENLVQKYGRKWSLISKFFYNRTEISLKCHYSLIERRKRKILKEINKIQNIEDQNMDKIEETGQDQEYHDIFELADINLDDFFNDFDL